MSGVCNFGENELPNGVPFPKELNPDDVESFADFNLYYKGYEIDLRTSAIYDPTLQKKIDGICSLYTPTQLELAIKDAEWQELSAKRKCYDAIVAMHTNPETVGEFEKAKGDMEMILANVTVMRMALERLDELR